MSVSYVLSCPWVHGCVGEEVGKLLRVFTRCEIVDCRCYIADIIL